MRDAATFIRNFLRNPTEIGAVAPSSSGLVHEMVDWFDWDAARGIVEFGCGTGVFTEAIERRRHPDAAFFALDKSPELVELTRARCPDVTVIEDSAANVQRHCQSMSIESVDAIVSGLPWAAFSEELQSEILDALFDVLRPGGQFATFAYWTGMVLPPGIRFSRLLHSRFQSVQRSQTVWRNLPPAFVYRCVR